MKNSFLLLILLLTSIIISINSVSAGLILSNTTINVNKSMGVNYPITLTLTNNEGFTFYNISAESQNYLQFTPISQLLSGQNVTFTANVIKDDIINIPIKILGYYYQSIGTSNISYVVNISNSDYGMSPCDFTIIKGDSVSWKNPYQTLSFTMYNADTNAGIDYAIPSNSTGAPKIFSQPGIFRYYLKDSLNIVWSTCTITILNDTGLVNNPIHNAILNLNIATNYPPTNISTAFLITNYSLNFYDTQQGVFSITNTGNNTAKNVRIASRWISFSPNNFDLNVGETKGIVYSINPIITSTSDTNKTYANIINITGNFNSIYQPINIFIKYAEISGNVSNSSQVQTLIDIICSKYPELCEKQPEIVYKYITAGDLSVNVSTTQNTLNQVLRMLLESRESETATMNYYKQTIEEMNKRDTEKSDVLKVLNSTISQMQEDQKNSSSALTIALIVSLLILLCGGVGAWVYLAKKTQLIRRAEEWRN